MTLVTFKNIKSSLKLLMLYHNLSAWNLATKLNLKIGYNEAYIWTLVLLWLRFKLMDPWLEIQVVPI